jgi:hypothetical protein
VSPLIAFCGSKDPDLIAELRRLSLRNPNAVKTSAVEKLVIALINRLHSFLILRHGNTLQPLILLMKSSIVTKRPDIGNVVTMGQLLEFDVAFPGEKPLTIEQYLSGGNKSIILNTAAFFLGFKNSKSEFSNNRRFIEMFFRKENNELANEIFSKIRTLERQGINVKIINSYSSLKLFEYYFSKPEEPETQTQAEFEVNLFKAYLVLNSEFIRRQDKAFESVNEIDEELKIPMMMFCMEYPVSDKSNYDIHQVWATQMIKAIYLFQFLESNPKAKPLLAAFLSYFKSPTWQYYLKNLLPLTVPAIKNEREAHTDINVTAGEKFDEGCEFIEKLMVQEKDELDPNDFLTIRARPFYKIEDGKYRIIFNLFVVEKIFKGVYFLLRDVNKTLPKDQRIKEIRSFYGDEFSEKVLCYKVIESIYSENCIHFSGKELADMHIDGAPDYYIRKDKNIILFESKDFLILANKKASFDFAVYEEEFQRVLYYETMADGKEKNKAVMQLINSIRRLLKKEFTADTDYHYKDVFIFPVLLTHDHQYDTPGFNELINYWFQDELLGLQEEGLFIHHVKPLTVVNIDSLIYNQVGLAESIPLHKTLDLYHEYKKVDNKKRKFKNQAEYEIFLEKYKQDRMSKLAPFSIFIDKYFHKQEIWKLPPILELVTPALFKEEFTKSEIHK